MKIIATILLCLSFSPLFARSPAVEPVTGISIDQYKEVEAGKDQGYDFSKNEPNYIKARSDAELSPTTAFFLVVASALPFIVWFGVMRALPDATPMENSNTGARPTLSVIKGEGKSESDDDHDSMPKAS